MTKPESHRAERRFDFEEVAALINYSAGRVGMVRFHHMSSAPDNVLERLQQVVRDVAAAAREVMSIERDWRESR